MATDAKKSTSALARLVARRHAIIAIWSVLGIGIHLLLRFVFHSTPQITGAPLLLVLFVGGLPLVIELGIKVKRLEFGSDLLAGISIITALLLHEWLAGAIVVLMLSGGETLENYA